MDPKIREEVFQACAEDLCSGRHLSREQWRILLEGRTRERAEKMAEKASALRDRIYGKRIFIRGLIEFTNYCRNLPLTFLWGKRRITAAVLLRHSWRNCTYRQK